MKTGKTMEIPDLNTPRIKQFLKNKGWFRSQTPELTRHKRDKLKQRLLNPPKNVKNWLMWAMRIKKAVDSTTQPKHDRKWSIMDDYFSTKSQNEGFLAGVCEGLFL